MGRQITSPGILQPGPDHATRRPADLRADRIAITLGPLQFQSDPMISRPRVVPQQNRRPAIISNQHIHSAVVIEIAQS